MLHQNMQWLENTINASVVRNQLKHQSKVSKDFPWLTFSDDVCINCVFLPLHILMQQVIHLIDVSVEIQYSPISV